MTKREITFRAKVVFSILGMALLVAAIAGTRLYAQLDPDRQLYDDDILFQQLSSGAQMRLIAEFGPKPAPPGLESAPLLNLLPTAPAAPPPTNVLVNNLADDRTNPRYPE